MMTPRYLFVLAISLIVTSCFYNRGVYMSGVEMLEQGSRICVCRSKSRAKNRAIIQNELLNPNYKIVLDIKMSQVQKLVKILSTKESFGESDVSCHTAEYAIVFLSDSNKVDHYISIDLDCDKVYSSLPIYQSRRDVLEHGGVCLSKKGKMKIYKYLKELNLPLGDFQGRSTW